MTIESCNQVLLIVRHLFPPFGFAPTTSILRWKPIKNAWPKKDLLNHQRSTWHELLRKGSEKGSPVKASDQDKRSLYYGFSLSRLQNADTERVIRHSPRPTERGRG